MAATSSRAPSRVASAPAPIRWSRYRFSSGSHDPVVVGTNREDGVQGCQREAIGIATARRCPRLRRSQVGGGIGMGRAHLRPGDTTHSHRRHGLTVGRRGYLSELRPVTARLTSAAVPGTGRPHPRSRWALGDRHARRPRAYALITRVPASADVEFVIIAKDQRSVIEGNRPTTGESPVAPVRTALGDHIAVIGDDDPRTAQTRIFYLPRTPRSAHAHPCTHRNPSTMPILATRSPHVLHLPRPHLGLAPTTLGRDNTTSSRMVSRVGITVE